MGDFTHPAYAAVFDAVEKAAAEGTYRTRDPGRQPSGCTGSPRPPSEEIRSLVAALAVEHRSPDRAALDGSWWPTPPSCSYSQ